MSNRDYPLRGFTNGRDLILTRGDTALERAAKSFPRGQTVWEVDRLPIYAAEVYSVSHPFDWLNRAPLCEGGERDREE